MSSGVRRIRLLHAVAVLAGVFLLAAAPAGGPPASAPSEGTPLASFALGVYLLEQGRADQAVGPLEEAWRESRHAPAVGARLAEAYYALRDAARAEQVVDDVLESEPGREDALQLKARLCYARRDSRAAIAYLERAREAGGASFETERMLASLYREAGDLANAVDALDRCRAIDPSIPHLNLMRGELLLELDRTAEAEEAFRSVLAFEPDNPDAIESLAILLEEQGRLAEMIPLLERTVAGAEASEASVLRLAEAYHAAGRSNDAIALLESRRSGGRLSMEGLVLLGRVNLEAGHYDAAMDVFKPIYERSGNNPELARVLGEIALKQGDTAASRAYFERAIAGDPSDYRNYMALFFAQAEAFAPEGPRVEMTPAQAAALLERASELAPADDFDANYMIGMALSSVDSLHLAQKHLERANTLKPGDRGTLFNLASVHEKQREFAEAENLLVELHALAPEDAAVCNFYGYVLAEMKKDLPLAERLVKKALEKEPDNGYFIDSLGWIHFQQGDYESAVSELERALRILGDDPVILEHLGDAYSALSRYRDALTAYQQSSSLQDANSALREKILSTERRLQ